MKKVLLSMLFLLAASTLLVGFTPASDSPEFSESDYFGHCVSETEYWIESFYWKDGSPTATVFRRLKNPDGSYGDAQMLTTTTAIALQVCAGLSPAGDLSSSDDAFDIASSDELAGFITDDENLTSDGVFGGCMYVTGTMLTSITWNTLTNTATVTIYENGEYTDYQTTATVAQADCAAHAGIEPPE
jgi:hypothetical protein